MENCGERAWIIVITRFMEHCDDKFVDRCNDKHVAHCDVKGHGAFL